MTIDPAWIDFNGHFNVAYYGVLFDRAGDQMMDLIGLNRDYVAATRSSWFSLETHTSYVRELAPTAKVFIDSQIVDHDHKRIHYVQQMHEANEGWLSCVFEVIISHISLDSHKTSNFPPDLLRNLNALAAAHKDLPTPAQVGHKIGIPRKF